MLPPPRFPIRIHVKPLFVECLLLKGYLSCSDYFYMVVFSDVLSILWRSIQQHRMRGTALVIKETAKSQCEFFTLNSRQPLIQMMSGFLAPKPHCKKLNAVMLFVWLSSTKMLCTIMTPSIEVVVQCLMLSIRRRLNTFTHGPIQTHPQH